jgi:hypothetical protein
MDPPGGISFVTLFILFGMLLSQREVNGGGWMPEFLLDGKLHYTPVEFAMARIGGTWKMPILWSLRDTVVRYSELKTSMPRITHTMLTTQLRELERDGLIDRKVYPVVPPGWSMPE